MKIITANYLDRNSEYKWLVRDEHEPIEKAVACKRVVADKVIFADSSAVEEGFGCHTVAKSLHVEMFDVWPEPKKPIRLWFGGKYFYPDSEMEPESRIHSVERLELRPDGKILAIV